MALGEVWTDAELDAIVSDYFAMLRDEIAGIPYNKTAHRNALMEKIDRPKGSIEFKHCNITAVLEELGVKGVDGYKPRVKYQAAILGAIKRHLDATGGKDLTDVPTAPQSPFRLMEAPAPAFSNEPKAPALASLVQKFDPVERDMRNRQLGLAGELAVLEYERHRLAAGGRSDLAKKVQHVSVEIGDGLGFDIASFSLEGAERLIEVKTTRGTRRTPFFMSRNERSVAEKAADRYRLYRVHEFGPAPALFTLRPPLEKAVRFSTQVWRAELS